MKKQISLSPKKISLNDLRNKTYSKEVVKKSANKLKVVSNNLADLVKLFPFENENENKNKKNS